MKNKWNARLGAAVLIACCVATAFVAPAFAADKADKKEVVKQARQSYYSLRGQGLSQFQCSAEPDWAMLLAEQQKTDPASFERAVKKLKEIHFVVALRPDGSVNVTHNDVTGDNDEMKKGLAQIYSGMEQMVSGFFATWSPFMLTNPFPEVESDYQLEDQGAQYRLAYKDGTADVVTTMGKDFNISEVNVVTKEFKSRMQPQFSKSSAGFLLSGYQAEYTGSQPGDATQLQVRVEYQSVNGLQLPQKLNLAGSYGGSPFQIEVAFTGCQADRK